MKRETLEMIIRSFNAVSKDTTRYHIGYSKICSFGDRFEICATDGHVLSCTEVIDEETGKIWAGSQYIHRDQLPALKLILKECGHRDIPVKKLGSGAIQIGLTLTITTERQVEWPDISTLKPTYPDDSFSVGLNPELLVNLLKSLSADTRQKWVKLTFKDKTSPILVTVGDNEGLLMPMRI